MTTKSIAVSSRGPDEWFILLFRAEQEGLLKIQELVNLTAYASCPTEHSNGREDYATTTPNYELQSSPPHQKLWTQLWYTATLDFQRYD